jgi:CRP-like cAMP-binding protein
MKFDHRKYLFRCDTLFDGLSNEHLQELSEFAMKKKLKRGEIIYEEASSPTAIYRLKSGKVKIEQSTEHGETRMVYLYTPGDFFGFRPLMSGAMHPVTAQAIEPCEIEIYAAKKFMKLTSRSEPLMTNMMSILSYEFNVWINLITSLSHKSTKERLAQILLILETKYDNPIDQCLIALSKRDMANYAETTEETVVRILSFFEREAIVAKKKNKIQILRNDTLRLLASVIE